MKTIALIAHDNKKHEIVEWVQSNIEKLRKYKLCGTGTTANLVTKESGLPVLPYRSGPLGGDQQIGAMVATGSIDIIIFFWDPMESQPHDSDVKALLRLGVVWNIPMACCAAAADFMITSPYMQSTYNSALTDYSQYLNRTIK